MIKKLTEVMNMIYEFTFENYRSYRHEATIDFTAKPINEFEQSLINGSNGQKLLPVCAIYGPNGGGKSSVIMAISEFRPPAPPPPPPPAPPPPPPVTIYSVSFFDI